jgi:anti-anti-sigma regulatory factor
MSSAVVNALLQLNRKAAARRGGLMLCNLAPDVKKLLKLMRLDEILSVHKSEMDAVTALKKAR